MHSTKEPHSSVPYRWWWGVGGVSIVAAVLSAFQGTQAWIAVALGCAGVTQLIIGFVERHRGAPPL